MIKHSLTAEKRRGIFSSSLFWAFVLCLSPGSLVVLQMTELRCRGLPGSSGLCSPARSPEAKPRAVCMHGTGLGFVHTGAVTVIPYEN